jgi:hypothetical protein
MKIGLFSSMHGVQSMSCLVVIMFFSTYLLVFWSLVFFQFRLVFSTFVVFPQNDFKVTSNYMKAVRSHFPTSKLHLTSFFVSSSDKTS